MAIKHSKHTVWMDVRVFTIIVLIIVLVSIISSLLLVREQVQRRLGTIPSGETVHPQTGEKIPLIYADPCEHIVSITDCL